MPIRKTIKAGNYFYGRKGKMSQYTDLRRVRALMDGIDPGIRAELIDELLSASHGHEEQATIDDLIDILEEDCGGGSWAKATSRGVPA